MLHVVLTAGLQTTVRYPAGKGNIVFATRSTEVWAQLFFCLVFTGGSFFGEKQPERETDHSL